MLCVRNVRVCQFGDFFWANSIQKQDVISCIYLLGVMESGGCLTMCNVFISFFYWLWTTYIMSMCVLKFVFLCFLKLQMSKCVKLWCLQKSLQLWMPSFFKWWLWFGVEVKLSASSFSLLFLFRTHWESVAGLTNTVYHICPGFLQFTLSPLCSWPSLFWSMWWWLFWWNI